MLKNCVLGKKGANLKVGDKVFSPGKTNLFCCQDLEHMTKFVHTGGLESLNSLATIKYMSKTFSYRYIPDKTWDTYFSTLWDCPLSLS